MTRMRVGLPIPAIPMDLRRNDVSTRVQRAAGGGRARVGKSPRICPCPQSPGEARSGCMSSRFFLLVCGVLWAALGGVVPPVCRAAQSPAAYSDAEAGKHVGEEATVTGRVVAVTKSAKGTTFLNFGDRFPQQIFSGVVFAGDAEKVGDLSGFEGKVVSLTGRIELSRDQKPQIVIRSATQLKASAPPAPPAATPPPAAPATPVASAVGETISPIAGASKTIVLAKNWASAPQTGEMTRKDLALLFGGQIAPGSKDPEPPALIYPGVPYLTPLASARSALNLDNTTPSRSKITTPGLPVASLTANVFTGIFPGGYTSLTLVCDIDDQVVSVLLVDENPRQRTPDITDISGYHTYNFIADRRKASNQVVIKHDLIRKGAPDGVLVVDSMLIDPDAPDPSAPVRKTTRPSNSFPVRQSRTGKLLERSRWYVPRPLADIILRASGNR